MKAQTLYAEAIGHGLRLEARGDKLAVIPASRCPPEFADTLRSHKGELLSWLEARSAGMRPDEAPWLHVAKQVLASEFDGADSYTRDSLVIGLRSIRHPVCQAALHRLRQNLRRR